MGNDVILGPLLFIMFGLIADIERFGGGFSGVILSSPELMLFWCPL
jgi:hypothetical protein